MKHFVTALLLSSVLSACSAPGSGAPDGVDSDAMERLDFREVVQSAKDKIFPAVVYIKCIRQDMQRGKKISQEVSGSGAIISRRGEVVTNWHVIDKAVEVRCLLYDGTPANAEVLGSDKDTDLALLKMDLPEEKLKDLPCAEFGDSDVLKEGDFVMTMGAPWGLSRSVSIGIISCTRRYLEGKSEYNLWLQTDAAINPGNSGGPLVNTKGELVGINTLGITRGDNLGFSNPASIVSNIISQIREHGKVNWSWTGLQLQPIRNFNKNMYFDATEGIIVAGTEPESPARRAGIQPRDRILRINDTPLDGITEEDLPFIRRFIGSLPKEKPAKVDLDRDGKAITLEMTPREKGIVEGEELDCPRWDFTVKAINQFDNPNLYFYQKEGVFIYGIKSPGNAANSGLSNQDILLKIDGKPVKTLDDVRDIHKELIDNVKKRHRVMFVVKRNGLMQQVVLDFSRDYEKE